MKKRTLKRTLSALLTLALAAGMLLAAVGSVFASNNTDKDPEKNPSLGMLTKSVVAADNATFDKTFTFTFVKMAGDGTTATEGMAITDQKIAIAANNGVAATGITKTAAGAGTATYAKSVTLIGTGGLIGTSVGETVDKTKFPHAGEYVYKVTEVQDNTGTDKDDWTYDTADYRMKIYIVNEKDTDGKYTGNLVLAGMTVAKVTDPTYPEEPGKKVDPTKPDPGVIEYGKLEGFTFLNKYAPKATLEITNKITGDYADLNKVFTFEDIKIDLPKYAEDLDPKTVTVTITDQKGTRTVDATNDNGVITIPKQELKGTDAKITIEGLPVGSDYSYKVDGEEGYKVKADNTNGLKENPTTVTVGPGKEGEGLTVDGTGTPILTAGTNKSIVTNEYRPVTPTGVIVKVLPFVLMIAVAAAGIALNLRSRRSRYTA